MSFSVTSNQFHRANNKGQSGITATQDRRALIYALRRETGLLDWSDRVYNRGIANHSLSVGEEGYPRGMSYDPSTATINVVRTDDQGEINQLISIDSANFSAIVIDLGPGRAHGTVYIPTVQELWVSDQIAGIHRIDTAVPMILGKIPLDGTPTKMLYSPANDRVYVARPGVRKVSSFSVMDPENPKLRHDFSLPREPTDLAFSPHHNQIYIGTSEGIQAIDCETDRLLETLVRANAPQTLLYLPVKQAFLVSSSMERQLTLFDPLLGRVVPVEYQPPQPLTGMVYHPLTGRVFLHHGKEITVLDEHTLTVVASIFTEPGIALSSDLHDSMIYCPRNNRVFLSQGGTGHEIVQIIFF